MPDLATASIPAAPPAARTPLPDSIIEGFTPAQIAAFDELIRGGTTTAAARAAKVDRSTLYEWLREGRPLAKALRQWKLDVLCGARLRALSLSRAAAAAVSAAIRGGDARLALRLLEGLGVISASGLGETFEEAKARRASALATIAEIERDERQADYDLMK
jgi:hypothetical protein